MTSYQTEVKGTGTGEYTAPHLNQLCSGRLDWGDGATSPIVLQLSKFAPHSTIWTPGAAYSNF